MNKYSVDTIAADLSRRTSNCTLAEPNPGTPFSLKRKRHLGATLLLTISLAIGSRAQTTLARVAVPSNDWCQVAVNVELNKIYVSGNYSGGQDVFVVDGSTFTGTDVGTGSTVSVDIKNDNYWAATVYGGSAGYSPAYMGVNNALGHLYVSNPNNSSVEVRNSTTGSLITSFSLGSSVLPQGIAVDSTRGRLYVGASTTGGTFLYAIEDLSTARKCLAVGTC
jgi:DNA-binding beta-propeller fold protein YncE